MIPSEQRDGFTPTPWTKRSRSDHSKMGKRLLHESGTDDELATTSRIVYFMVKWFGDKARDAAGMHRPSHNKAKDAVVALGTIRLDGRSTTLPPVS